METIYPAIANRLRAEVPALKTIDVEDGQLDDRENAFPITYPAVFIDVAESDWKDVSRLAQMGDVTIDVIVAIQLNHRTKQGNPDMDKLTAQLAIFKEVNIALHGWAGDTFGRLTRTKSRKKNSKNGVKALTHTYVCQIKDDLSIPATTLTPKPPIEVEFKA